LWHAASSGRVVGRYGDGGGEKKLEEVMAFMLLEFGAVLRGEEVPLVSLARMLAFWEDCVTSEQPHIMVTLKGRFKGEAGHRWYCVPISVSNQSGIPFKLCWGPLFKSSTGKLRKIKDVHPHIIELLDKVRAAYPTN
jgi:hypothetical protein